MPPARRCPDGVGRAPRTHRRHRRALRRSSRDRNCARRRVGQALPWPRLPLYPQWWRTSRIRPSLRRRNTVSVMTADERRLQSVANWTSFLEVLGTGEEVLVADLVRLLRESAWHELEID